MDGAHGPGSPPVPDVVRNKALADGTAAVLKVLIPRSFDAAREETTALRLANGDGCVRLLRADPARGAMLLERLGPSMHSLGLSIGQRHEILCACAARMWRCRPGPGCGLPTGADKGRRLAEPITRAWAELDGPCSSRAVSYALECAARGVVKRVATGLLATSIGLQPVGEQMLFAADRIATRVPTWRP